MPNITYLVLSSVHSQDLKQAGIPEDMIHQTHLEALILKSLPMTQ